MPPKSFAREIALAVLALSSCRPSDGCLGGDDGHCVPTSACPALGFECSSRWVAIRRVGSPADRPPGEKAAAARGDLLLENELVTAVLDDPNSPHFLAPSGGSLIDLLPRDGSSKDSLNQVFQSVGILPDDAARYHRVDVLDESPELVAAIYRGTLDGRPEIDIVTRYELRPCEPGLRIRTEIYHGGRDPLAVLPADAYFWGDRGPTPFTPGRGLGFAHPTLELKTIGDAIRDVPFVVADPHDDSGAAYGVVACDRTLLAGFHSTTLSAVGAARRILMPGDATAWERVVLTTAGPGEAEATRLVWAVRQGLFGEQTTTVTGRVVDDLGHAVGGSERSISLLAYEPAAGRDPDDLAGAVPWAPAVPGADGTFELTVPAGRNYRIALYRLGRRVAEPVAFSATSEPLGLGDLTVPALARLDARVVDAAAEPLVSELVLVPAARGATAVGSVFGLFAEDRCVPYLGPPHGGSPACNRVLVGPEGRASFEVEPGSYLVYATHGPFWSLGRQPVELRSGVTTTVELSLVPLSLLPEGVLSADFHVHSGSSFDSSLPERDRALGFAAAGIDVVAATDHDVVSNYEDALQELGLEGIVRVLPGVETTGQILFLRPPGSDIPKVIGHFNFWPLGYDSLAPRNGAPDDERLEPDALFDRVRPLYAGRGVAQLNHPFAAAPLGRDEGYLSAVGYGPDQPVPAHDDATAPGQLRRVSRLGTSNLDFDVEEVMNGASVQGFLRYRAGWFSFLSQGIWRAGTANSDSHSLGTDLLGYPRNLVFGGHTRAGFDADRFDESVRRGEMVGTNGPVITACISADEGTCRGPALAAFRPASSAELAIVVEAAPWIPVDEVRIYVSGLLVRQIAAPDPAGLDPFGTSGLERLRISLPLAELLGATGEDAWIVVEAGMALPLVGDLDQDGLVDTTDNNGDGRVDAADEKLRFQEPGRIGTDSRRFHLEVVAPGVLPTAFTNPFFIDLDGDGWNAPGLA